MSAIIEKLSSYNLFNYLFPGVVFCSALNEWTEFQLVQQDILVGFFVYYFIGSAISRFGSLVVDPILKKLAIVRFADYKDFVKASSIDTKIDMLSEQNNVYRTLISLTFLILVGKGSDFLFRYWPSLAPWGPYLLSFAVLCLFIVSYRKQTEYVRKRVEVALSNK